MNCEHLLWCGRVRIVWRRWEGWFEGEIRGRGVYRVRTVSRVRIVWGRDEGLFEGEIRGRGR